jgi:hypothetical protein
MHIQIIVKKNLLRKKTNEKKEKNTTAQIRD